MKNLIVDIGSVKYFIDMFNLQDIKNIYLKKSEIDHCRKNGDYQRSEKLFNDFLELLYPDIPNSYREYVFIYNLVVSEGKTDYKLEYVCDHCNKRSIILFKVHTNDGFFKYKIDEKTFILFEYLTEYNVKLYELEKYIHGIEINGLVIKWDKLSESTKRSIMSYLPMSELHGLFEKLYICKAEVKFPTKKCCDKSNLELGDRLIYGGFPIFDVLVNPKNLANFYQLNHQLMARGISLSDQMEMNPFERSIYVNMIIKQEKEELEKNEVNRFSRNRN